MRRIRVQPRDPAIPATSFLPEVDPALRDAPDPDPVVEEMVERLRSSLQGMVALDAYGRPVPWRQVVRIALGATLHDLREAAQDRVIVLPSDDAEPEVAEAEVVGAERAAVPEALPPAGGRHYRPS